MENLSTQTFGLSISRTEHFFLTNLHNRHISILNICTHRHPDCLVFILSFCSLKHSDGLIIMLNDCSHKHPDCLTLHIKSLFTLTFRLLHLWTFVRMNPQVCHFSILNICSYTPSDCLVSILYTQMYRLSHYHMEQLNTQTLKDCLVFISTICSHKP